MCSPLLCSRGPVSWGCDRPRGRGTEARLLHSHSVDLYLYWFSMIKTVTNNSFHLKFICLLFLQLWVSPIKKWHMPQFPRARQIALNCLFCESKAHEYYIFYYLKEKKEANSYIWEGWTGPCLQFCLKNDDLTLKIRHTSICRFRH